MAGKTPLQLTDDELPLQYCTKSPRTTRDDEFHCVYIIPDTGLLRTRNRVSLRCDVPPLLIQSSWDVLNPSVQTFYAQPFSH